MLLPRTCAASLRWREGTRLRLDLRRQRVEVQPCGTSIPSESVQTSSTSSTNHPAAVQNDRASVLDWAVADRGGVVPATSSEAAWSRA
eukprot:948597-Rhodomonas_salina.1